MNTLNWRIDDDHATDLVAHGGIRGGVFCAGSAQSPGTLTHRGATTDFARLGPLGVRQCGKSHRFIDDRYHAITSHGALYCAFGLIAEPSLYAHRLSLIRCFSAGYTFSTATHFSTGAQPMARRVSALDSDPVLSRERTARLLNQLRSATKEQCRLRAHVMDLERPDTAAGLARRVTERRRAKEPVGTSLRYRSPGVSKYVLPP